MTSPSTYPAPLPPRRPWLAVLLNLFFVGVGALYAGSLHWAFVSAAIPVVALILGTAILLLVPPSGLVVLLAAGMLLLSMVGPGWIGWRLARRAPVPFVPTRYNRWYWYVGFGVAAGLVSTFGLRPLVGEHLIKAYRIPSEAMEPTLQVGDFLYVDRRASARQTPGRQKLVVFVSVEDGATEVIKRVGAVGGDTIAMRGGLVLINGREQRDDPFLEIADPVTTERLAQQIKEWTSGAFAGVVPADYAPDASNWGPVVVPAGHFFALGDNRNSSWDSRFYGLVPVENITGTPRVIYFQRYFLLPGKFSRVGTAPR